MNAIAKFLPKDRPLRIVFAHTNYPAQFGMLGDWLSGEGCEVVFITQREGASRVNSPVRIVECRNHREVTKDVHRYARGFEKAAITGQAFARAAVDLAKEGFRPDLVMAHAGWGAGAFLKDVWTGAAYVPYFEWYYQYPPVDRLWSDPPENPVEGRAYNRARNSTLWLDFSGADAALCPTEFQASQFPDTYRRRLTVMHDGLDTDLHSPGDRSRDILSRWGIPEDAEVLTSITRGMEPHRGFPEIMRAIARLQKERPRLHAIVGGEDRVAYGAKLPEGDSWKKRMLAELDLDHSRLHFIGLLSRPDMVRTLRASDVHTYLTVPFVLSWSLLDSMSCGCLIVASDTEPVREFMDDNRTGLLVPMHDAEALAARIAFALDEGSNLEPIRERARARIVRRLDAKRIIWPRKLTFIQETVARNRQRLAAVAA